MSFTAELGSKNNDLFEEFWAHPFLRGLHSGDASADSVIHYVGQDARYLDSFIRCYGAGIARSPDREWAAWFAEQIRFLLEDELHPHRALCAAVGISYDDVRPQELAPSAQAYVDHMERCAQVSLGVMLAAQLPCVWTYTWAGSRAMGQDPLPAGCRFEPWWQFYGSPECRAICDEFRARTDQLAERAGPAERDQMARAFERSCRHEVRFWEMAWSLEDWTSRSFLPAGHS